MIGKLGIKVCYHDSMPIVIVQEKETKNIK